MASPKPDQQRVLDPRLLVEADDEAEEAAVEHEPERGRQRDHRQQRRRTGSSPSERASQNAAVAAEHDQLAVGDVEHLEHPEDQRQPGRRQAVEAAEQQAEDELLEAGRSSSTRDGQRSEVRRRTSGIGEERRRRALAGDRGRARARSRGGRGRAPRARSARPGRPTTPRPVDLAEHPKIASTIRGARPERRLVEHEQPRPGHERAPDGDHLLLAARQRAGELASALAQAREHRVDRVQAGRLLGPRARA